MIEWFVMYNRIVSDEHEFVCRLYGDNKTLTGEQSNLAARYIFVCSLRVTVWSMLIKWPLYVTL